MCASGDQKKERKTFLVLVRGGWREVGGDGGSGKHLKTSVRKVFIASIEDERRAAVEKTSWMERMKGQNISPWQENITRNLATNWQENITRNLANNWQENITRNLAQTLARKYNKKFCKKKWQENITKTGKKI